MDPGAPFGGRGPQDKDTIPDVGDRYVVPDRWGEVAPQAPVDFGEDMSALEETLDVSATTGKKALK